MQIDKNLEGMAVSDERKMLKNLARAASSARAPAPSQRHWELGQEAYLQVYRQLNLWPGEHYAYVGNSYNVEYKIIGSDFESRRAGCISLMIERLGDRNNLVPLPEAFLFDGFMEILSRFERDWLKRLPEDVLIGPALEKNGLRVRHAFAVWRPAAKPAKMQKSLLHA